MNIMVKLTEYKKLQIKFLKRFKHELVVNELLDVDEAAKITMDSQLIYYMNNNKTIHIGMAIYLFVGRPIPNHVNDEICYDDDFLF